MKPFRGGEVPEIEADPELATSAGKEQVYEKIRIAIGRLHEI
jgi:hypothetical protein